MPTDRLLCNAHPGRELVAVANMQFALVRSEVLNLVVEKNFQIRKFWKRNFVKKATNWNRISTKNTKKRDEKRSYFNTYAVP